MIRTIKSAHRSHSAFTLVEMLVVVAVLGIMATVGVVNLNQNRVKMIEVKNKRNAQQVTSVFRAAQSSGLDFFQAGDSVEDVVRNVVQGGTVTVGPLAGNFFGMKGMNEEEIIGTLEYLQMNATQKFLIYQESGGGPTLIP